MIVIWNKIPRLRFRIRSLMILIGLLAWLLARTPSRVQPDLVGALLRTNLAARYPGRQVEFQVIKREALGAKALAAPGGKPMDMWRYTVDLTVADVSPKGGGPMFEKREIFDVGFE